MTLQQRQSHLMQQISQVSDENVLIMLENELSFHLKNKNSFDLNAIDLNELIMLADEPENKDIVSENEYRRATDRWRLK